MRGREGEDQAALSSHMGHQHARQGPSMQDRVGLQSHAQATWAGHQAETPHWQGVPAAILAFLGAILTNYSIVLQIYVHWRKLEEETKIRLN